MLHEFVGRLEGVMMKRVALTLLILSLTIPCLGKYSGGTGEPNDPYQIANVADLITLANDANDYNKFFILTADIDLDPNLPGNQVFTTAVIARDTNNANYDFDGNAFTGIFDGADYKILNLTIDTNGIGNDYLGLFGDINTNGEVKNLGLENINITSRYASYSFGIGGLAGLNAGSIRKCHSTGNLNGNGTVGGLIGGNDYGNIDNCYSTSAVSSHTHAGGLVGYNLYGIIKNSYATGTVNVSGGIGMVSCHAGGLSGYNYYASIDNSYATGNVNVNPLIGNMYSYAGGLTGRNYGASNSNCYTSGNVSVTGEKYIYAGGLAGDNTGDSNIINCYAIGSVEVSGGVHYIGGLVGKNSSDINNSYFLDPSDGGGPNNGYGTPLTDEEMKQQASFVGWDFSTPVWRIYEGRCYPYLGWEKYGGGSGTPTNPYRIWTVAELLAMAADTNDYNKCFILMSDLDLDPNLPGNKVFNTAVIAPFIYMDGGFQGVSFTGVFDGMGHKIFNLTIDANSSTINDSIGLIGHIYYGEVKNTGVENVRITCDNNSYSVGGLAGLSDAGTIRNCYSTGTIACGNKTNFAGGLVGYNVGGGWIGDFNSIVNNCYSTCSVTVGNNSGYIGGLAGYNNNSGSNISDCFSTGNVSAGLSSHYVGGLVGRNSGTIISSYFLDVAGPNNGNGTPLTDEEMKQQSNFVGWDFNDVWHICETTNYPKLIWQILPADIICPDGVDSYDLAVLCGQWLFEKIPADVAPLGGDGIVNFADFAVFADQWGVSEDIDTLLDFSEQWLKVGLPGHSADISPLPTGDGIVNFADLAVMADYWLEGF
jgi:hypothetical protein